MKRPKPEGAINVDLTSGRSRRGLVLHRAIILAALTPVVGVMGQGAPRLFHEMTGLSGEWNREEEGRIIGYAGIVPKLNFARAPENWFQRTEGKARLWGGWEDGVGHHWFELDPDDLENERLTYPIGRDVFRAIDVPMEEHRGDDRWERLQDQARVFEYTAGGVSTAYPFLVMDRVWLVNDTIDGRPVLIACRQVSEKDHVVEAFLPVIEGEGRVTFGSSGYHYKGQPLLYDRASESLWVVGEQGLESIAGKYQGTILPKLQAAIATTFGKWSAEHPGGRLIVGADRSAGRPKR